MVRALLLGLTWPHLKASCPTWNATYCDPARRTGAINCRHLNQSKMASRLHSRACGRGQERIKPFWRGTTIKRPITLPPPNLALTFSLCLPAWLVSLRPHPYIPPWPCGWIISSWNSSQTHIHMHAHTHTKTNHNGRPSFPEPTLISLSFFPPLQSAFPTKKKCAIHISNQSPSLHSWSTMACIALYTQGWESRRKRGKGSPTR